MALGAGLPADSRRPVRQRVGMTPDELARDFAAEHFGVIDRANARRLGLTDRQIQARVRSGAWVRQSRSVFTLVGSPETDSSRLVAAVWCTGGAVSHRSAGWWLRLLDTAPARPSVVLPPSAHHGQRGVTVHRSSDLDDGDVRSERGLRCTTPERTVLDLCAVLDDEDAWKAIGRTLRQGLTTSDRIVARHVALSRRGRPGAARARRLLVRLDPDLAKLESELEHVLYDLLVRSGLPRPVPQYRVEVGGRRYRIDLCYPEHRIAIEGDGFGVHTETSTFESDRDRQNELVLAGWRVLRFTWRQVVDRPDWVVDQVRRALAA
jgi:very-short-patch-repair endonuclease